MKSMLIVAAAVSALFAQNAMAADGKGTYTKACASCHATGAANAPKFGDKAAWAPRIKTGMPALYNVALIQKGGAGVWGSVPMPPNNVTPAEAKELATWVLAQK